MKLLVIIFCVFLSSSAELSPQKFVLSLIYSETRGGPLSDNPKKVKIAECLINKMEVVGVEISEKELIEGIKLIIEKAAGSDRTIFHRQVIKALAAAFDICEYEINPAKRQEMSEKVLSEKEITIRDEDLNCYKTELKQLEPSLEMLKDYEIDQSCDSSEFPDNSDSILREYYNLNITKCSVEEFGKLDDHKTLHAFELKYLLMLHASNKLLDEIVDSVISERRKLHGDLLKCMLDQIYDR